MAYNLSRRRFLGSVFALAAAPVVAKLALGDGVALRSVAHPIADFAHSGAEVTMRQFIDASFLETKEILIANVMNQGFATTHIGLHKYFKPRDRESWAQQVGQAADRQSKARFSGRHPYDHLTVEIVDG